MKRSKRVFALLLAIVMVFSNLAFAADGDGEGEGEGGGSASTQNVTFVTRMEKYDTASHAIDTSGTITTAEAGDVVALTFGLRNNTESALTVGSYGLTLNYSAAYLEPYAQDTAGVGDFASRGYRARTTLGLTVTPGSDGVMTLGVGADPSSETFEAGASRDLGVVLFQVKDIGYSTEVREAEFKFTNLSAAEANNAILTADAQDRTLTVSAPPVSTGDLTVTNPPDDTLIVPADGTDPVSTGAYSTDAATADGVVLWSLYPHMTGVDINPTTGVVTVTNAAKESVTGTEGVSIDVVAQTAITSKTGVGTLTIKRDAPVLTKVLLSENEDLSNAREDVSVVSGMETVYLYYTARDQYGETYGEDLTWAFSTPDNSSLANITLESNRIAIGDHHEAGTYYMNAENAQMVSAHATFRIDTKPVTELKLSMETTTVVQGASESLLYELVDQEGDAVSGAVITITPAEDNLEEITLNGEIFAQGNVIRVLNNAPAGRYFIQAEKGGVESNKIVLIVSESLNTVTINTQFANAVIYVPATGEGDQDAHFQLVNNANGQVLNNNLYTWIYTFAMRGVSIKDGIMTVTNEAFPYVDPVEGKWLTVAVVYDEERVGETSVHLVRQDPYLTEVTLTPPAVKAGQDGSAQAEAIDQYGAPITSGVTFQIASGGSGVTIDSETGHITVENTAQVGTYTIRATHSGRREDAELDVSRSASVADRITVGSPMETVDVPDLNGSPATVRFSATVLDQYGDRMMPEDAKVNWTFAPVRDGVSIDPDTGILTITNEAAAAIPDTTGEQFYVVGTVNGTQVTASAPLLIKRADPVLTKLLLVDPDDGEAKESITLNTSERIDPTSQDKTTTVATKAFDQYGEELTDLSSWYVNPSGSGVSVENNAVKVEITAPETMFTIQAERNGAQVSAYLNVEHGSSVPDTLAISPHTETEEIPALGGTNKSVTFTCSMTDQFGEALADKTIHWTLTPERTGVYIDPETTKDPESTEVKVIITPEAAQSIPDTTGVQFSLTALAAENGAKDVAYLVVKRAAPVLTSMTLEDGGGNTITSVVTGTEIDDITARTFDQYGAAVSGIQSWSVSPAGQGVDVQDGTVSVEMTAPAVSYTIQARKDGATASTQLAVSRAGAVAGDISVTPARREVIVPADGEPAETAQFTAAVKDQFGAEMDSPLIYWYLSPAGSGVSIDRSTGLVTVTNDAKSVVTDTTGREFTVTAVSGGNGRSATATVLVRRQESRLTSLTISPDTVQTGTSAQGIKAVARDQYHEIVTGATWTVKPSDPQVSVNGGETEAEKEGEISIGTTAKAGTYEITAQKGTYSASDELYVSRADAVAQSVTLTPAAQSVFVPSNGSADGNSVTFTAEVRDQYGDRMSSEAAGLVWNVFPTTAGVTIDTAGKVTVTNAAKTSVTNVTGKLLTVIARTSNNMQGEASLTVRRDEQVLTSVSLSSESVRTGDTNTEVTATPLDQYGAQIAGVSEWKLEPLEQGVTITNGKISVIPTAQSGQYKVTASRDGVTASTPFTVQRADSVPARISIAPAQESLEIPADGFPPTTRQFDAVVIDQYGDRMAEAEINWMLAANPQGVTVSHSSGLSATVSAANEAKTAVVDTTGTDVTVIASTDNGRSATAKLTVKRAEPRLTSLDLSSTTLQTGGTAASVTATPKDQYGKAVEGAQWTISPASGVVVNDGVITAETRAAMGPYTVTATKNGYSVSGEVYITRADASADEVQVSPPQQIMDIPAEGAESNVSQAFTASVLNQYGEGMTGIPVTWSLYPAVTGVRIDPATGIVTVDSSARSGVTGTNGREITVIAVTGNGKTGTASLVVRRADTHLAEVRLSASSVQAGRVETPVTAAALDQYGGEISGVRWSVDSASGGVSISESGLITVEATASGGSCTVTAAKDGYTASATLTVVRAESSAVEIAVTPRTAALDIPADNVTTPGVALFTAQIKDQFGNRITDELVSWSIQPNVEGVSITADGRANVTNAAKTSIPNTNGVLFTVTATAGSGAFGTAQLTIRRAASQASAVQILSDGVSIREDTLNSGSSRTYTTRVVDQYGVELSGAQAVLSLTNQQTGFAISGNTVSVAAGTRPGAAATLNATYTDSAGRTISTTADLTASRLDVDWSTLGTPKSTLTYGDAKASIFAGKTFPVSSDSAAANGTGLIGGTFTIEEPDEILPAASTPQYVRVRFTPSDGTAGTTRDFPVTVEPKPLTISGLSAAGRVYDGTSDMTRQIRVPETPQLSGILPQDAGGVSLTSVNGATALDSTGAPSKDVGTKTIRVSVTLDGAKASNYAQTLANTLTAPITAKALTVSVTPVSRKYESGNRTVDLTVGALQGVIPGDEGKVSLRSATGTMTDDKAGVNKPVTAALELEGAEAANYTVSQPTGLTVTITPFAFEVEASSAPVNTSGLTGALAAVSYSGTRVDTAELKTAAESAAADALQALADAGTINTQSGQLKVDVTAAIEPKSYDSTAGSLTLDVSLRYTVTENGTVKSSGELDSVGGDVTVTYNVPSGFRPVNVIHTRKSGETEYLNFTQEAGSNVVTWKQSSFSPVTLVARQTASVTFYDGNSVITTIGSTGTLSYSAASPLPTYSKSGYTFRGWIIDTISATTPYTALSSDMLAAIAGRSVTARASLTPTGTPVTPTDQSVTITFYDGTSLLTGIGTNGVVRYTAPTTLPSYNKAGYLFNGWVIEDAPSSGVYQTLSAALLTALNGKSVRATASLTVNSGGGSSSGGGGSSSGGGGGGGGGSSSSTSYKVEVIQSSHGTISASRTTASRGTTVRITVKPDSGYELGRLLVEDKDGEAIGTTLKSGTYRFTMPASSVTVSASFVTEGSGGADSSDGTYYTVSTIGSANGLITASPLRAQYGDVITVTATPYSGYQLDFLTVEDAAGNAFNVYGATFTMPASDVTVRATYTTGSSDNANPFTDVTSGPFLNAILWAYRNGVTSGITSTTFAPGETCTRAQTVTFLWRASGSPTPKSRWSNRFTDVEYGTYYYDAVQWAVEQGITNGITANSFRPNESVTRAQVVTFLHRLDKAETSAAYSYAASVGSYNPFTDVWQGAGIYYYDAVLWAVENGITNGITATTFAPGERCTRGQIVTFLYRYMQN